MSSLIESIHDAEFETKVLQSPQPILVDFWAEWCNPCKAIAPILEEIAEEYKDRIKIVKLDVDKNSEIPVQYGIRGIPTLILFKEGENVATRIGGLTKSQLSAFIDQHL